MKLKELYITIKTSKPILKPSRIPQEMWYTSRQDPLLAGYFVSEQKNQFSSSHGVFPRWTDQLDFIIV